MHPLPFAQLAAQDPPQSTSVSEPSLMPSTHMEMHVWFAVQTWVLVQSVLVRHSTQAPLPSHLPVVQFVPAALFVVPHVWLVQVGSWHSPAVQSAGTLQPRHWPVALHTWLPPPQDVPAGRGL